MYGYGSFCIIYGISSSEVVTALWQKSDVLIFFIKCPRRVWIQTFYTKLQQFCLFRITAVKWAAGGKIHYLCTTRITKKLRLCMNCIYWEWYSQVFQSHVVISFTQSCVSQSGELHSILTRDWALRGGYFIVLQSWCCHLFTCGMFQTGVFRTFNILYLFWFQLSMCPKWLANSSPKSIPAFSESELYQEFGINFFNNVFFFFFFLN